MKLINFRISHLKREMCVSSSCYTVSIEIADLAVLHTYPSEKCMHALIVIYFSG
jgi:hypothetical protein